MFTSVGSQMKVKLAKSMELQSVDINSLTISYYPGFNASLTEQRRRLLSKYYLFECQCPPCSDTKGNRIKHYAAKKQCPTCQKALLIFGDQYACLHCQHKIPADSDEER